MAVIGQSSLTAPCARRVDKPWGEENVFTEASLPYTGKLLHVLGGRRLSLQRHDVKTETILLLHGRARLTLATPDGGLEDFEMVAGVGYTIRAGQVHRLSAITDALLVEASTPERGMTERLEDDFGRAHEALESRQ